MTELLEKLLALASRPGTEAEGRLARERADRIAAALGLVVYEDAAGELSLVDPWKAELLAALDRIASGALARGELPPRVVSVSTDERRSTE